MLIFRSVLRLSSGRQPSRRPKHRQPRSTQWPRSRQPKNSLSLLGLGFRHTRTEFHGGYNEFSVGYAKGAASNLNTSLDDPTRFLKHAEALLIQENFLTGGAIHCRAFGPG